jgi:hypothetical protein
MHKPSSTIRVGRPISLAIVLAAVVGWLTMAATAEASNRCTRYVGSPSGIFYSASCPAATSYGTVSTSQPDSTSSVALRDNNYIGVTQGVCPPTRLFAYYYNPNRGSIGAVTDGCAGGLLLAYGSDGYSYSRCKLNHDGGVYTTRQADCRTAWTE